MTTPTDKRDLLAQLFAGNIGPEEFKQQARQRPGGLIGRAMSRDYAEGEKPGPGDLITYQDPETGQTRRALGSEFAQLASYYDNSILVVYSGDTPEPPRTEDEIPDPDEPETEETRKARKAAREKIYARHWAEYQQQKKTA